MSTYDHDRAEALARMKHAYPSDVPEHIATAQVHATLALAAAVHDMTLREYTEPIDLVPVEPQSGAGQPLAAWERELYAAPADASGYSAPLPDGVPDGYVEAPALTGLAHAIGHTGRVYVPAPDVPAAELGVVCGSVLISKERVRQQTVEGYTASHDAAHGARALLAAASCYAILPPAIVVADSTPPTLWPWLPEYWKPKGPLRNLVRAGALAQAAIDADEPPALFAAEAEDLRDVCTERLDVLLAEARQVLYAPPELDVPPRSLGGVFDPTAHGLPAVIEDADALRDVLQDLNESGAYHVCLPILDARGHWWMAYEFEIGGDDVGFAVEDDDPGLRTEVREVQPGIEWPVYDQRALDAVAYPVTILAAPNAG